MTYDSLISYTFFLTAARDWSQNPVFPTMSSDRSVHGRLELPDERALLEMATVRQQEQNFQEGYAFTCKEGLLAFSSTVGSW